MNNIQIKDSLKPQDWVFKKGLKSLFHTKTIGSTGINPSGDWEPYLPTIEYQQFRNYDDFGCVTHSAQNALETLAYFKIVNGDTQLREVLEKFDCIDEYDRPNFDDWFSVLMSGTIPWRGNNQRNVWESFRKDGLIGQQFEFNDLTTQAMYTDKSKITPEMIKKAKAILEYLDINWEWVDRVMIGWFGKKVYSSESMLKEAFTQSPLHVVVANGTHAEMGYSLYKTFNSYKGNEHKTYKSNTDWWYVIKCDISVKDNVRDINRFIKKYQNKFVKGDGAGIYMIDNGKKRPFTSWFDYLCFDGSKTNFERVNELYIDMIPTGRPIDVRESPHWDYIKNNYDTLKEMSAPDNIKRLEQLIHNS